MKNKYLKVLRKKRFYVFLLSLIFFLMISYFVMRYNILGIDNNFYNLISSNIMNDKLTSIMKIITHLSSAPFLIILTLVLLLFLKNKYYKIGIVVNLCIAFLVNTLLKLFFLRDRPNINQLISITGYSFPSGHAMTGMAYYGFIIYLLYVYFDNKKIKWPIIIILSILILLIGFSRIYLGVHYLTDVIGGYLLSISYLIVFVYFFNRIIKK